MATLIQNDSPPIRRGRETGRRAGGYALTQNDNPYVGPRTFRPEERAKFFGRSREARDLTAMIISNRLVLFYAPSGAGKSSLLNTMIGPMLVEAGFELLPTGRVSGASVDAGGDAARAANIYVYNLLLSLQQAEDPSVDFTSLTLPHFLDNLDQREDGLYAYDLTYVYPPEAIFKPRVLIIDQFEELLTTNRASWTQREGFFEQLAAAMAFDEQLWVALAMREDYVARLRPYLHLTPNRLRARYYMERLTRPAAIEAMQMPVAGIRPFEPDAVAQLADDLRRIRSAGGEESAQFYQFVEPVQLQAVCYQMWEKLHVTSGNRITTDDVAKYANVDTALINFYEETIQKTVAATDISEIDLRAWFDRELITEAGTRNMVFRGEETTGGLPTAVADFVRGQFILAEVVRPGGAWYELVHERFVEPITAANNRWRQDQPLIQLAQGWAEAGRPAGRLLSGPQLEQLAPSEWQELSPLVAEYVAAARAAQEEAEK
jgi:energy-coupling factor transporter ATP-binding protein EcfA2